MAGLSLKCGDCGSALRTVEEAQEHAELTRHSNFVESAEAVLNLVCSSCGKPCRSQTEVDLHTKRTGHADFIDKTQEAAKPIDLEAKPQPMDVDVPAAGPMLTPEVDKDLLEQLEGMGFGKNKAIRAIYCGKAQDLEAAVNWIVEHEGDPDIDTELLVPAAEVKTPLSAEEAKAKAKELVERAKRKKEEEEKRMEREREKERIRVGREMLEAKKKEEENERKRILMYRKAEKEEEKRAREKIKQKIAEDKAERRRKLGLPPEEPAKDTSDPVTAPTPPATTPAAAEEKRIPAKPISKSEELRSCLRSMKQAHKDDDGKVNKAFQTLQTYIGNVGRNPQEEKFRRIRVSNQAFQERVGSLGGVKVLELCGFEMDESKEYLCLARDKVDVSVLRAADHELHSAISNPFFGVL